MLNNITDQLIGIDDYINQILNDWKVPGAAVVVVKGEEVVYSKGFGVRDINTQTPVNDQTQFRIASNTKAFVALSLGLLVDEGKLEWDKPIKNYLPDFKLYNQYLTDKVTIRDLLSHRTGLPAHDWAFNDRSLTRKECIDRLQYLEPNYDKIGRAHV